MCSWVVLTELSLGEAVHKAHTAGPLLPLLSGHLSPWPRLLARLGSSQDIPQLRLHTSLEASQENLKS